MIKFICLFFVLHVFIIDAGWSFGVNYKDKKLNMSALTMNIDGVNYFYHNEDTIYVFPDQRIKIIGADLISERKPSFINLVGLVHGLPDKDAWDDRGYSFKPDELLKEWAVDSDGKLFKIDIKTSHYLSGRVYLKVVDPYIEWIEVYVNDKKRIIRDQDFLDFKKSDKFKVGRIKLNLDSSKDITYKTVKLDQKSSFESFEGGTVLPNYSYYELIFMYKSRKLASFPMRITQ